MKLKKKGLISTLKGNKAFSLIELLVVVAIIGVLAAVAIPSYQKYQDNAKAVVVASTIKQIKKAFIACDIFNSFYTCYSFPHNINDTLTYPDGILVGGIFGSLEACFSVRVSDPIDDKKHKGCITFLPSGIIDSETFDDGTKEGRCNPRCI